MKGPPRRAAHLGAGLAGAARQAQVLRRCSPTRRSRFAARACSISAAAAGRTSLVRRRRRALRGADLDGAHEVRSATTARSEAATASTTWSLRSRCWSMSGTSARTWAKRAACCARRMAAALHARQLAVPPASRRTTGAGPPRAAARGRSARLPPGAHEPVVGPLAWTTVFRSLGIAHALKALPLLGPLLAGSRPRCFNVRRGSRTASRRARSPRTTPASTSALFRREAIARWSRALLLGGPAVRAAAQRAS